MAKKRKARPDRYDASGNVEAQYVDEAQTVLVNKLGITDLPALQVAEEEGLARAYETLLGEVHVDTPMTVALIQEIHARIFGALYDWAGRWRTVWIRKPGVTWPPPDFLDEAMREFEGKALGVYPAAALETDESFCAGAAHIQGEFLIIHPFREGNARTIKLVTNLLAVQTGRPLLIYDTSPPGIEQYIAAAQAAFTRKYAPLAQIIRTALDAARQSP